MPEQNKFSNFDEEKIIAMYMGKFGINQGYAVDIGASNGVCSSNTLALYRNGWSGLCIEYDPAKFAHLASNYQSHPAVSLCRVRVTPYNVCKILSAFRFDGKIDFLNIDIDGYDYFVLNAILDEYRPLLISAEINQSIPPPVKFTVNYSPCYRWASDGFFGMSLSQVEKLCCDHNYQIACLEYNNVFIIPAELYTEQDRMVLEIYKKGFLDRPDNKNMLVSDWPMINAILTLSDDEKIKYIDQAFFKYKGKFTCHL